MALNNVPVNDYKGYARTAAKRYQSMNRTFFIMEGLYLKHFAVTENLKLNIHKMLIANFEENF
jgi:hypothetical protein